MRRYLLLASVAGCLLNAGNALAGIADGAQSATLTASVSLKSAHVLGGTTAINFGTLMLKRDQIPTDGSAVSVAYFDFGAFNTNSTYVQAKSGVTSTAALTIDGFDGENPGWSSLGDITITKTCNTTFVSGKGCKISGNSDTLEVYIGGYDTSGTITETIGDISELSSLFNDDGYGVDIRVATEDANWEDVTLTDVNAYTVTLDY